MNQPQFDSLDDALGPARDRYFGRGYHRISHEITDAVLHTEGAHVRFRARGAVSYPEAWSSKADRQLAPHLSTIDMIVLSASLAELSVAHQNGLNAADRRRSWISSIELRAGTKPHLDLGDIPLAGTSTRTSRTISDVHVTVGAAKATIVVHHEGGSGDRRDAEYKNVTDALAPAEQRIYGSAYKRSTISSASIRVDLNELTLHTSHRVEPAHVSADAESAYGRSVSYLDALVTTAQLGQVLMYTIDDIARADSNTFWLRKITLSATGPDRVPRGRISSALRTTKTTLLERGSSRWRASELAVEFGGVHATASVAHEIPAP
ncbi:AvrD family protein [Okibacterium endophyticum]